MNASARRFQCFLLGTSLLCGVATAAHADDSTPNPKYLGWANFKPGSSSTVESDMQTQGMKIHITMTRTLISLDSDKAVLQVNSSVSMMGQQHDAPARTEIVKAKGDPDAMTPAGEKDVDAMGKTFKCKVFEAARKLSTTTTSTPPQTGKATIYVNDQVPGGLVRLETASQVGATEQQMVFILTAMQVK